MGWAILFEARIARARSGYENCRGLVTREGEVGPVSGFCIERALRKHARLSVVGLAAHLASSYDAYYVGLPFWGLASMVGSYLWLKSRYIPRVLAAVGVVSSAWCVICAFAFIVFPHFEAVVNGVVRRADGCLRNDHGSLASIQRFESIWA
jgi:hypothetical protein